MISLQESMQQQNGGLPVGSLTSTGAAEAGRDGHNRNNNAAIANGGFIRYPAGLLKAIFIVCSDVENAKI
jgi:hypothetical protein